jgi:hypothetical protein
MNSVILLLLAAALMLAGAAYLHALAVQPEPRRAAARLPAPVGRRER